MPDKFGFESDSESESEPRESPGLESGLGLLVLLCLLGIDGGPDPPKIMGALGLGLGLLLLRFVPGAPAGMGHAQGALTGSSLPLLLGASSYCMHLWTDEPHGCHNKHAVTMIFDSACSLGHLHSIYVHYHVDIYPRAVVYTGSVRLCRGIW